MSRDTTVDSSEIGEHFPNSNLNVNVNPSKSIYIHDDTTVRFLARNTNFDDPLYHVITSDLFQDYARKALRPEYDKLPKKVLRRKLIDVYKEFKKYLVLELAKVNGRVVVSCDLWSSFSGDDHYVCVIGHWTNEYWGVENRVLGFEMLYPYDHVDVASKVMEVLDEYNLKEKVGSFSFDDGDSKEKCMEHLGDGFDPFVLELCYDRSFANAVYVCAQQILEELDSSLRPVRDLVKWFQVNPEKRREFKNLWKCSPRSGYVLPTKFYSDFFKEWESTYEHLEHIQENKEVLHEVYNSCADHSPLQKSQWEAADDVFWLLEAFYDASFRFSRPYYATCHLVIYDCITIAKTFKSHQDNRRLRVVIRNIKRNWLELVREVPTIYCVATMLDPRIKVEGLRRLLVYYYETLGVNYNVDKKVADCENALQQLYARYAPPSCSGEVENMDLSSIEFDVFTHVRKRKRVDDREKGRDIDEYLSYEFEFCSDDEDEHFDIQTWWSNREELFPVLSKVVKDVLCAPISTKIPKSNCCPVKRVLDEKRSRLCPDLIHVCICKEDWDSTDTKANDRWDFSDSNSDSEAED